MWWIYWAHSRTSCTFLDRNTCSHGSTYGNRCLLDFCFAYYGNCSVWRQTQRLYFLESRNTFPMYDKSRSNALLKQRWQPDRKKKGNGGKIGLCPLFFWSIRSIFSLMKRRRTYVAQRHLALHARTIRSCGKCITGSMRTPLKAWFIVLPHASCEDNVGAMFFFFFFCNIRWNFHHPR